MKEAENSISEEANIAIGRNANSRYLEKFSKKNFTIAGIRTRDFRLPVKHPINWAIETLDSSPLRFPYIFDSTFSTDSSRIFQSILFIYSMICRISLISLICIRFEMASHRWWPDLRRLDLKKKKKESTSCRLPRFNQSVGLTWPSLDSE